MKFHYSKYILFLLVVVVSCTGSLDYPAAVKAETSGRYIYNADAVIDLFYKDDVLYMNWKGAEIKPVALDEYTFFVPDMYQKLRFMKHPKTDKPYLAIIPESETDTISYAYLKVTDSFKTPSMHLKHKNYDAALQGFMAIKKQDSTSVFINESELNRMGYNFLSTKAYTDAIAIFKINTALHPQSDNVYDSLADAYLKHGDSLLAFKNYKKALGLNPSNRRAKAFVDKYKKAELD